MSENHPLSLGTREDLDALFLRLDPKVKHVIGTGTISPVRIAECIATSYWVNREPENSDTEQLRYQLNHLYNEGHWDIQQFKLKDSDV